MWLSHWQSDREDRRGFSTQLLTAGVSDANESTPGAFEVDDDSWFRSESQLLFFSLQHFASQKV